MNNPEVVAAAKARWGLDRSLPEQYLIYLGNLVQGDLGTSFRTKRPVLTDIADRLPATLELVIAAMIVGTLMGIALGVLAAAPRDRLADHVARLFALFGSSLPVFWSGLILLFVFSVKLGWLPGPGRLDARRGAAVRDRLLHHRCAARRRSRTSPMRCGICSCRPSCSAGR